MITIATGEALADSAVRAKLREAQRGVAVTRAKMAEARRKLWRGPGKRMIKARRKHTRETVPGS